MKYQLIESKNNNKIKHLLSLRKNKVRQQELLFIGEGRKNLDLALASHVVKEIYSIDKDIFSNIDESIDCYLVNQILLDKISELNDSDGIIFVAKITNDHNKKLNHLIYLDHVQDPGNVGTIIRSALAFNFDGVILGEGCASLYNSKTLQACKGSNYLINVIQDDLSSYPHHQRIVTALANNAIAPSQVVLKDKFILIIGNEGHGVSDAIMNQADIVTKINISNIDSLNAGVAASILMYEFAKVIAKQ